MPARLSSQAYAQVATEESDAEDSELPLLYARPPPPPGWAELAVPERDAESDSSGDEGAGVPRTGDGHGDRGERAEDEVSQAEEGDGRARRITEEPPQYQLYELEAMPLGQLRELALVSAGIDAEAFDSLLHSVKAPPNRPKKAIALKLAEAHSRLPTNWHRVRWEPSGQLYYWDAETNAVQFDHPAAQYRRRSGFQVLIGTPRAGAADPEGAPAPLPVGLNANAEEALRTLCSLCCAVFGLYLMWAFVAWVFG